MVRYPLPYDRSVISETNNPPPQGSGQWDGLTDKNRTLKIKYSLKQPDGSPEALNQELNNHTNPAYQTKKQIHL